MTYHVSWQPHGTVLKFSQHVNFDDVLKADFAALSDPRFAHEQYRLVDCLGITSHDFSNHSVGSTLPNNQETNNINADQTSHGDTVTDQNQHNKKIAIVCQDTTAIELAAYYREQGIPLRGQVEIFNNHTDARAWTTH